jgi:hypothetical protein
MAMAWVSQSAGSGTLFSSVLFCSVQFSSVQFCSVQFCSVQFSSVQCSLLCAANATQRGPCILYPVLYPRIHSGSGGEEEGARIAGRPMSRQRQQQWSNGEMPRASRMHAPDWSDRDGYEIERHGMSCNVPFFAVHMGIGYSKVTLERDSLAGSHLMLRRWPARSSFSQPARQDSQPGQQHTELFQAKAVVSSRLVPVVCVPWSGF